MQAKRLYFLRITWFIRFYELNAVLQEYSLVNKAAHTRTYHVLGWNEIANLSKLGYSPIFNRRFVQSKKINIPELWSASTR